jgi:hypothetical protein
VATGPLILANAWGGAWAAAWAGAWGNDWGQFTAEIYIAPAGNTRRNKVKAKVLAPVFARPGSWVVLEVVVGCTMWAIAAGLLLRG